MSTIKNWFIVVVPSCLPMAVYASDSLLDKLDPPCDILGMLGRMEHPVAPLMGERLLAKHLAL